MEQSKPPSLSVLFVCTGNACRSQIAEGWARSLFEQSSLGKFCRFQVASAGLEAHGVNPLAIDVMAESGVDISAHASDVLTDDMLEQADWLITLCDHAEQHCPVIPEGVKHCHWRLDDPTAAPETIPDKRAPFRQTRDELKKLISAWLEEQVVWLSCHSGLSLSAVEYSRETLYQGFMNLQRLTIKHRLFEGGWSQPFQRELLVRHQAVMVLLYDPVADALVLIEQFRVGALTDPHGPWLLEMVAGVVDVDESLETVACREALEEAGCEILALEPITQVWTSPGGTDEQITIFCGRVDSQGVGGVHGLVDEHENIYVRVVPYERALQALAYGIIRDASGTIAMQWLQLNRDDLRKRWGR